MKLFIDIIYFNVDNALFLFSVVTYNLFYHQMETDKLLIALYIVQGMVSPVFFVPRFFVSLYETIISLERIQNF